MSYTLPTAADQTTEYEDYYETSLSQPLGVSDTDIYPETMPASAAGFLVIDPAGSSPETIFYNFKGANFVRCPSSTDGQGRGVGATTPNPYDAGTKIGMYSIAAFYEGIVTGKFMRDGFLQARHFSSTVNPNNWTGTGQTLVFGANIGQKVSTYVATGDVTSKYVRGTALQLPRVAATNTQCSDLEASSSQYAKLTTPTGIDWTGPFTVEAMVKLESYDSVNSQVIVSRDAGSGAGWSFEISNGRLRVYWRNASNATDFLSYQCLPLGQWVHVAAVITSVSSPAALMYIDTVSTSVFTNGTAASTLIQGGDLAIGGRQASSYMDGKLSEVRVWSTARTAQQLLDNSNKRLVGTESNLAGYWRLNGDFGDLSPNGNTLVGQNGAVATAVDTPFATTEYGVVTDATFSSGTTTISVYTGNRSIAPAEDIVNASYSYSRTPPGFPAASSNWVIHVLCQVDITKTSPAQNVWYNIGGLTIAAPVGDWIAGYEGVFYTTKSGGNIVACRVTLSTANNTESDHRLTAAGQAEGATGQITVLQTLKRSAQISVTPSRLYYLNMSAASAAADSVTILGAFFGMLDITLACPYF